jgi:hypothetical protein
MALASCVACRCQTRNQPGEPRSDQTGCPQLCSPYLKLEASEGTAYRSCIRSIDVEPRTGIPFSVKISTQLYVGIRPGL